MVTYALCLQEVMGIDLCQFDWLSIVGVLPSVEDLKQVLGDQEIRSLDACARMAATDPAGFQSWGIHWEYEADILGKHCTLPLGTAGDGSAVTAAEFPEYVKLKLRALFGGVKVWSAVQSIRKGIDDVDVNLRTQLRRRFVGSAELVPIVRASLVLDVDQWKAITKYELGTDEGSPPVGAFWAAMSNAAEEFKLKVWQFATGRHRVPAGDLAHSGVKFEISVQSGSGVRRPEAHTCDHSLVLWSGYSSDVSLMVEKLEEAVANTHFGFM